MKRRLLVWFSLLVVVVLWTSLGWAQQPRYGGTLRIALPGDPAFYNAHQVHEQALVLFEQAWLEK